MTSKPPVFPSEEVFPLARAKRSRPLIFLVFVLQFDKFLCFLLSIFLLKDRSFLCWMVSFTPVGKEGFSPSSPHLLIGLQTNRGNLVIGHINLGNDQC